VVDGHSGAPPARAFGFFATLGLPVLAGHDFTDADHLVKIASLWLGNVAPR